MIFRKQFRRKHSINLLCFLSLLVLLVFLQACSDTGQEKQMQDGFSSKVEFGEALFFDKALSLDSSISCATCHKPELAFADHNSRAIGIYGRVSLRNVPSILNVKNLHAFLFDASVPTLEMQALVPIQDSNEMGMMMGDLIQRLKDNQQYTASAKKLFKRELDAFVLTRSLAEYQRTLLSEDSPFDSYLSGNKRALSESAQRGWKIFNEKLYCSACHPAPNFTIGEARNSGYMSNLDDDFGRFRHTGSEEDRNTFKVPSLRNVALTYPYMHDGSLQTLDEVLTYYMNGNRHPGVDSSIQSFSLSEEEREDLLSFLKSLTGRSVQKSKK